MANIGGMQQQRPMGQWQGGPGGMVPGPGGMVPGPGGMVQGPGGMAQGPGGMVQGPGMVHVQRSATPGGPQVRPMMGGFQQMQVDGPYFDIISLPNFS